jgi:hypothetical protein
MKFLIVLWFAKAIIAATGEWLQIKSRQKKSGIK